LAVGSCVRVVDSAVCEGCILGEVRPAGFAAGGLHYGKLIGRACYDSVMKAGSDDAGDEISKGGDTVHENYIRQYG
jgi:hypothetical protein